MASRAASHEAGSKGAGGARAGGGPEGHGEVIGETRTWPKLTALPAARAVHVRGFLMMETAPRRPKETVPPRASWDD